MKQEWQTPVLEELNAKQTENSLMTPLDDGSGPFSGS